MSDCLTAFLYDRPGGMATTLSRKQTLVSDCPTAVLTVLVTSILLRHPIIMSESLTALFNDCAGGMASALLCLMV